MDNNEIIDYVMQTPSNSNPNVMRGILGKGSGENNDQFVIIEGTSSGVFTPGTYKTTISLDDVYNADSSKTVIIRLTNMNISCVVPYRATPIPSTGNIEIPLAYANGGTNRLAIVFDYDQHKVFLVKNF